MNNEARDALEEMGKVIAEHGIVKPILAVLFVFFSIVGLVSPGKSPPTTQKMLAEPVAPAVKPPPTDTSETNRSFT